MGEEVNYRPPSRAMQNYGAVSPNGSGREVDPFSAGQTTCPTCRGTGRIRRDEENELVALIPVRDKRLKPRRTVLYVGVAVTVCLVTAGLLMFFLLPRSVVLSSKVKMLKPLHVEISTQPTMYVKLSIRTQYNVSNENFFPITVTSLNMRVLFDGQVMLDTTNTTALPVPLRGARIYSMDFNVTFEGGLGDLAYYCNRSSLFPHTIWMPFQATATTAYYGHTEESILNFVQQVECSGKSNK